MVVPEVAEKKMAKLLEEVRAFGRWEAYVACADEHMLVVPCKAGFTIEVGGKEGVHAGWWSTRAEAAEVCRTLTAGFRLIATLARQ